MPSGGGSPLAEKDWHYVRIIYNDAIRNGLQYEFLQWMLGSMVNDKMSVQEAALAAAIEWDF